jgi:hypothetical protein
VASVRVVVHVVLAAAPNHEEQSTMAASKQKMVTAVFQDRFNAHAAYDWLVSQGYTANEINLLMSADTKARYYAEAGEAKGKHKAGTHAAEGMAAGGAIGTAVGAAAAAIAAIGTSLVVPGLGLVVAGPVAAALAGGGAGAVAGGVIGGLIGLGVPESNAKAYEEALREGGIVVGVVPHNAQDASRVKDKFQELHGENIITV